MIRNLMAGLVAVLSVPLLTSCTTTHEMKRAEIVPAAEGSIEAKLGDNKNVELQIVVDHLAPPDRIAPGSSVYVVWATPASEGSVAQNLGALVIDAKLKGKLKSVTPHKDFNVTITPEPSATATEPTGPVVLERRITIR